MSVQCQQKCTNGNIVFGVDILFWFNAPDPNTGESMGIVTFKGVRKSLDKFCIDFFDNVGIMNYRDNVYGMDSMLYHGQDILDYATSVDKRNVLMGLETSLHKGILEKLTFGDDSCAFLKSEMFKADREFAQSKAYAGQALHAFTSLEELCPVDLL